MACKVCGAYCKTDICYGCKEKKQEPASKIHHKLDRKELVVLLRAINWYKEVFVDYPDCEYQKYHFNDITSILYKIINTVEKKFENDLKNSKFGNIPPFTRILFVAFNSGYLPESFEDEIRKKEIVQNRKGLSDGFLDKLANKFNI